MHKNMNTQNLISIINTDELTYEATSLMAWEMGVVDNIDDVAQFMWKGGPFPPQASAKRPSKIKLSEDDPRPKKKYWYFVKNEMFRFLCENNPKYKELWIRIGKLENKSTSAIVLVISGYIGEKSGVEGIILAGFVAVCLYGAAKVSKEALCEYLKANNA